MIASTGIVPAPPILGGAIESHAYVVANAVASKGAKIHFLSDITPGAKFHPNIQTHPLHSPLRKFPVPFPTWILTHSLGGLLTAKTGYEVTLSQKPDVAHFHEETSAALYLSLKPRVPTVFTLHSPISWDGETPPRAEAAIRRLFTEITAQRVVRKVARFVALSTSVAQYFSDWVGLDRTRISVIPHPIDTDFFRPDREAEGISRQKLGLKGPYILFVGRLDPRKNVRTLLRAVAKLRTRPITVIVGDGVERESLMSLAKAIGVDSSIRFLGPVPVQLLPGLYSGAEFVVLPSLSEMSPMTVIEALSCGAPVVATRLSVLRDVITHGQNGLLISPTTEELSNTIATLDSDNALKHKMKDYARRRVLETNSLGVVADQLLAIYNEACA